MRAKHPDVDTERRQAFTERLRGWTERWGAHDGRYATRLSRVEAGEPEPVQAWELFEGLPSDQDYVLEPNGALTVLVRA